MANPTGIGLDPVGSALAGIIVCVIGLMFFAGRVISNGLA
jgi:hypothetical protein